jgi:hypothetical protein
VLRILLGHVKVIECDRLIAHHTSSPIHLRRVHPVCVEVWTWRV